LLVESPKNCVPSVRSNRSWKSATVSTGSAKTSRNCTTNVIHTKTGMRIRLMPGARMFTIVVRKFTAATVEEMPRMIKPSA
jgi:hypothetical protein